MKGMKTWGMGVIASVICLAFHPTDAEAGTLTAGKSHIGTFEGSTTFTTSSSNGIHPGLFLEVRDADGDLKQYTSEDGVITVPNTKEGAYVTKAKLLGKTKYRDQDTGELLDEWEAGRNLKLESVENPALKTTGKNLLAPRTKNQAYNIPREVELEVGKTYYWYNGDTTERFKVSKDGYSLGGTEDVLIDSFEQTGSFVYSNPEYKVFSLSDSLVVSTEPVTFYQSYQSSLLGANEDVELRGIGGVRDELDLIKSEWIQRIGKLVLDGSEQWKPMSWWIQDKTMGFEIPLANSAVNAWSADSYSDKLPTNKDFDHFSKTDIESISLSPIWGILGIRVFKEKLLTQDVDGLKFYLSQNPINVQYQLATELIETVNLTSTYAFNLISDGVVKVNGNVIPTIYSVTVPSEPLTFAINPNAEAGQQFIAPEFSITNEGTGPVELELKSFTQKTNVLNDVLPDQHTNWTLLDKTESRDFALALVPKASEAWLTLQEGPKYVANTANTLLGKIKPKGTVDFSFTASHGTVFDQNLYPEYQLIFTFGF